MCRNMLGISNILARRVAGCLSALPNVETIAIAGSQTGGIVDAASDLDLYVYQTSEIPLVERVAIVQKLGASRADMNNLFWGPGDEWVDAATGIGVDVVYWDVRWMEEQIDRVLVRHQASVGYTTCFWGTVLHSVALYDKNGWFRALQERSSQPYPEELRRAIVAYNHPILRRVIPAYLYQIQKAIRRNDLVSVNHRVAALLASYFDVLFALNRVPNPGEKRLVQIATQRCANVPAGMARQVEDVIRAASDADERLVARIEVLVDGLDELMCAEGFDPETSLPAAGAR